jgi:hypothetical protein
MKTLLKHLAIGVMAVAAVACGSASSDSSSDLENGTHGPGAIHPGWFKSPEAISQTIAQTWSIDLTEEEELQYLGGLRASLGGVSVAQQSSLVDRPHELFVLSTHSLSVFVAQKLVKKQIDKTAAGEGYLFDGLGFSLDDDGCYADDAKTWCDGKDGITIGSLTQRAFDPNAATKEDRKRLMHKMQAIGEFFLMAIDERTMMPGAENKHAPQYLLDEVFLPKLKEAPLSAEQEQKAWEEVVSTILMSGYFFDLPADE